jgi:serine/threonine-protein kinase
MSPEQASLGALGGPDGRSDLFSAAVVLYELATGERLFYRGSDAATLDCVRKGEVSPTPRALNLLPKPLYEILLKALQRLPETATGAPGSFGRPCWILRRPPGWMSAAKNWRRLSMI